MKQLGPSFGREIIAAGLGGLPFSWGGTSDQIADDGLMPEQQATLQQVIAAHDPSKPFVPTAVTPRQARLALLGAGLLDQAEAAVQNVGGAAKITWDFASIIERDNQLIEQLGAGLGLNAAQIDALFIQAASL